MLDITLARLVILLARLTAVGSGPRLAVALLGALLAILAPALAAGAALFAGAAATMLLLVAILPLISLLTHNASSFRMINKGGLPSDAARKRK